MARRWIWGASALACLAAGAALAQAPAAGAPKRGGALQVVVTPEPPMLMQGLNQNGPTNMISGNIYESLLRYDERLQPMPSLAKSWDISADQTVYTFRLQEGVVWHDGKPFTADDVVFTLNTFLRETHPRWRLIANAQVKAIEKVDDLTVRITLKQPFGPFLLSQEVSSAPMIPKHIYDGAGDYRANPMNATPIGTGPMKFKEWRRGSYIQLVRNEQYWDKPKPYLDEIYFQFIPDAAARATAFESGRVDVLTGGAVEIFDVARLAKLPNTCVTNKGWEMFAPHAWITPNVKNGILGNKQFRQAMMYAIDREFGRDVVWSGYGKIATGPISSKTKFYSADVPKYAYDPKKAKELVKASGYKGDRLDRRAGLDAEDLELGFRPHLQLPVPARRSRDRRRPVLHLVEHREGKPLRQCRAILQSGGRPALRRGRERADGAAPGALHEGAADPGRRAAAPLAPRARLPDSVALQREGPRDECGRHQRRREERLEAVRLSEAPPRVMAGLVPATSIT